MAIVTAISVQAIMVNMAKNGHNDHNGLVQYVCDYGHYGYLWKDISKCRSPVKTVLKKMDSVKSYSQNNCPKFKLAGLAAR